MVQKITRKDRHSALYIHCICIFIIRTTDSRLRRAETSVIWLNDCCREPRRAPPLPRGGHRSRWLPRSDAPRLRSQLAAVPGQVPLGAPSSSKTKCPIFSRMRVIDLKLFKHNEKTSNCYFPPLLASSVLFRDFSPQEFGFHAVI